MSQLEVSSSSEMAASPCSIPSQPPPKPSGPSAGERLLMLLIRFIVMCFALPLFFLFASVSALILLHLCLAGHALRRHHHYQSPSNLNPNPSCAISSADLKRMACFRWPWPPDRSCAVCLEAVRQGEMCRRLKACEHVFHKGCVDEWLLLSPNCPLCREIVRPDGWI